MSLPVVFQIKEEDKKEQNRSRRHLHPLVWGPTYWTFLFRWSRYVDLLPDLKHQKYAKYALTFLLMLPDLMVCLMCESHVWKELQLSGDVMENVIQSRKLTEWFWKLRTKIQKRQLQEAWSLLGNDQQEEKRKLLEEWRVKQNTLEETIKKYEMKSTEKPETFILRFLSFVVYSQLGETQPSRMENLRLFWKYMSVFFPYFPPSVLTFCSSQVKKETEEIRVITMKTWIESLQSVFQWSAKDLEFFVWYF
jgi:hypothetical protein